MPAIATTAGSGVSESSSETGEADSNTGANSKKGVSEEGEGAGKKPPRKHGWQHTCYAIG